MENKIYLKQIAEFVERKKGKQQQILFLQGNNKEIKYKVITDEGEVDAPMFCICDADIKVTKAIYHDNYGLGLNAKNSSMEEIHKNHNKVSVILWDFEVEQDSSGFYVNTEGALNGILVFYNIFDYKNEVICTQEMIDEMLKLKI